MRYLYQNFEPAVCGRLFVLKRGVAGAVGSVVSSEMNNRTQKEINADNLRESARNRQFQSDQAEINRKWQEEQNKQNQLWQESMVDKQNQWSESMWNKTNEYNSPSAQLQRAKDAGINPNFVLGGSMTIAQPMSSSSAPSASLPSGSVPSGSMASLSNANPWQFDVASDLLKLSQAKKTQEETKSTMSFNKFSDRIHEMGLKMSEAEIAKSYSDISVNDQKIENMQTEVGKTLVEIKNLEADVRLKAIDEFYKSKEYDAAIENFVQDSGLKKAQAYYMLAKLPSEIRSNNADAHLKEARAELTKHEIAQCDAYVSILQTQSQQSRWNLLMSYRYDKDFNEQALDKQTYENSTWSRGVDATTKLVGAVATGVGIYAAGKGMKTHKVKDNGTWFAGQRLE